MTSGNKQANSPVVLLRMPEVQQLTGLARPTIYKMIQRDPSFPRPVKLNDSGARNAPVDRLHQYLQAKQVKPYILRQLSQGRLLVPLCCAGQLVNLQIVLPSGEKRYLSGGQVQGCYSPLGKITEGCRLYVCEGWATGATLHAYTGSPVVCAMSAGNLKPVAIALRERYGEALDLVIAGDDDRQTQGNPGRTAANRAATAATARVVFPEWPAGAPNTLSDFNDLHLWRSQHREILP
ncbi:toprim domain-containing protein [Pseudomonas aeruginosa]|uniref:toprim domain-containing protein n=1 Tax=Pseudomonas aeruginosa TaxID=287 RepID=UPI0034D20FAC